MGRNGKQPAVFPRVIEFINNNVGKIVDTQSLLLGKEPGRNSETAYLYKFIKLGYVQFATGKFIKDKDATFKILKAFPKHYNSIMLKDELRVANGFAPMSNAHKIY